MHRVSKLAAVAVALSALVSLVSGDEGKHTVQFTAEKFAAEVPESPHFVMFFAPWCGHCQRLKPTWEDLAKKMNVKTEDEGGKATVGQVDCTVETELCSQQDVTGYPTLKLFKPGQAEGIRYRGQRDLASLESFIKENLSPKEPKQPEKREATDEGEAQAVTGAIDLTESNFHDHVAKGDHFVKFFAPWCGHCQRLAPTWEELAKSLAHDNRASIAKVDCTQHRAVCNEYDIKGYPTLLWIRDGKKVDKYQGSRSHEDLKQFVEKMTIGEAQEAPKTASEEGKVPDPSQGSSVVQLVDANFVNGVAKGFTFVKFYAPWCGHCKRMAPTWDQLAVKFVGSPTVKIAKVDCADSINRQLCSAQGVNGFPTMFIYKDGNKLEEYDGTRTLDDMHSFVTRFLARDEL